LVENELHSLIPQDMAKAKGGNGMTKKVADLLVDVLAEAGVQRIYGVVGDSLNGITDSIRIKKNIEWVHVRHEEAGLLPPEPKRI